MKIHALLACLLPLAPHVIPAQPVAADSSLLSFGAATLDAPDSPGADSLFARRGKSVATVLTGIPYVGLAEYTYGFTDNFSLGVFAGAVTPTIQGYGLRPRYVLAQPADDRRVILKMPVVYYPRTKALTPWHLAWPTVSFEKRRASGTRLWSGAGLVYISGADARDDVNAGHVYGSGSGGHSYGKRSTPASSGAVASGAPAYGDRVHRGVWNTFQVGFSKPLARRITFHFEGAVVLRGVKLASASNWITGIPFILTTGAAYSF